jgi:hypothetical protein
MDPLVLSVVAAMQVVSPVRILSGVVLVAILVVGVVFALRAAFGGRKSQGNLPEPPAAAGVSLNCPHCDGETDAASPQCRHCGKEL